MHPRAIPPLLALALLSGLAAAANATTPGSPTEAAMHARLNDRPVLLAQAAAPAPAASAPAADAQPDNRDTPARPTVRRRGVGVVISMSVA